MWPDYHHCPPCAVQWVGSAPCWLCGADGVKGKDESAGKQPGTPYGSPGSWERAERNAS